MVHKLHGGEREEEEKEEIRVLDRGSHDLRNLQIVTASQMNVDVNG